MKQIIGTTNETFSSEDALRRAYITTTLNALEDAQPGGVVLGIGQYLNEDTIATRISGPLESAFARVSSGLEREGPVTEDTHILRQVRERGLTELHRTEVRNDGGWVFQLNEFRSLRPKRGAEEKPNSIYQPVDFTRSFHFDLPRVQNERVWRGEMCRRDASLFINKFPFAKLHGLLVPEQEEHHIQFIFPDQHSWLWEVVRTVALNIRGFCAGYNSLAAFPSVKQFHVQTAVEPTGLPVTASRWRHNGGDRDYPLPCKAFSEPREGWRWIEDRVRANEAFNLLYVPGRVYCFPRRFQGSYSQAPWSSGFAWYECAGGIITVDREAYGLLTPELVEAEFHKMRIA